MNDNNSQILEDLRTTLLGKVGKIVKSTLPFTATKQTVSPQPVIPPSAPAQNTAAQPTVKILAREQLPLEYKLHYLEPTLTAQERLADIQEFVYLVSSQLDYNLDLAFSKAIKSLSDGYLEAKGYFRIQHNTHTHFTRSLIDEVPEGWPSLDFWLQVPHESGEHLPPDLYRYDVGAVLQKNGQNEIVDATLVCFVNSNGKISRPKVWEKKTPGELQIMAKEFLRFIPERERPPVGTIGRNGEEKSYYIELVNQDARSYRQCFISQAGYIRIDLKYKTPLRTLA